MDKIEAIKLLDRQMSELRMLPYDKFYDWQQKKHIEVFDIQSVSNKFYKIEVQCVLEDSARPYGNVRVVATIDDSHLLSFTSSFPIAKAFVISPNNVIVG